MQEKQDQKVVLVSLSIHINFEHEEHTQKKKNPDLPTQISYGYAIFAADLLGHGRSNGLCCHLGDMEKIAGSSLSFFLHICNSEPYKLLPAFNFGELG